MIHRTCRFKSIGLLALFLTLPCFLSAQNPAAVPLTLQDALHQMSDLAGIIFVGEVLTVRHRAGEQGASGVVEIDFRIDQAVRGCNPATTYTLREWAGLWEGGDERYRPGQRLLLMLHSPGPSGITSPVDGMNGAIPIRAASPAPLTVSSASVDRLATPSDPAPLMVDLRWVETRLSRPIPYLPSSSLARGTNSVSTADLAAADASPILTQAPISSVIGMLNSWQQAAP